MGGGIHNGRFIDIHLDYDFIMTHTHLLLQNSQLPCDYCINPILDKKSLPKSIVEIIA